jgi:pilus assembly protein Flp/PilA
MRRLLKNFVKDESGTTAMEYALIAAGLSIVIIASVNGVGTALIGKFTAVSTAVK